MSESETLKIEEPPARSREIPDEEREKKNAYQRAYNKRKRAEKKVAAVSARSGLDSEESAEMELTRKLDAAERKIRDGAVPESHRKMINRKIKVDVFTIKDEWVELTPSMCDHRDCPFDAAREAGTAGWDDAPVDQMMSEGRTFGERLIQMVEYHKATAHTNKILNDHVITVEELGKREWAMGNSVRGEFLPGAGKRHL